MSSLWSAANDLVNRAEVNKVAGEVRALSVLLAMRSGAGLEREVSEAPPNLLESLEQCRRLLKGVLEKQPPTAAETTQALSPAPAEVAGLDGRATAPAIALADWLERCAEDERIPPQRVLPVAKQKCDALLSALGLERFARTGPVNEAEQTISGVAACEDPACHLHVAETVQAGYRQGDRIIRPQTVIAYRCSGRRDER